MGKSKAIKEDKIKVVLCLCMALFVSANVMAGIPGRIVKEISTVRTIEDRDAFSLSPEFLEYKKQLLSFLE